MQDRICEQCGRVYAPFHPSQRWCSTICRMDYRNAEAQRARALYAKAGKPSLEEIEKREVA